MNEVVQMPPMLDQRGSTKDPQLTPVTPEDDQFTFSTIRVRLASLVKDWQPIIEKAKENRKTRDVDVSTEALRREGKLDEDETFIPVRVVEKNITREMPPYINYLKNSRRLCIFTCLDEPGLLTDKLELEFTRGMTYPRWENVHYKKLDGAATHGWDATEVVFDTTKPFNVGVEHVGFDNLYWPRTCKDDIQKAPRIIRAYDYTIAEMRDFVNRFGWSAAQVNHIIDARKAGQKEAETNRVYKVMFRKDGIVQSGWFALDDGCDDWLKAPSQHYIGIDEQDKVTGKWVPTPLTEYPIFLLAYRESEKPKLIDRKGRVFLDGPKQEAESEILSSYINGLSRATRLLASPKNDDGTGNSIKALANTELESGTILDHPVDFYNPPYPDPQILKALSWMDTSNSDETNQVNFAVMNREDSRKTAKEMTLAEQQGNMLNSVQLTLFSTDIRCTYSLVWLVVRSQALQGNIQFLLINNKRPQTSVLDGQPVIGPDGQPVMVDNWVNDVVTIQHEYDVRAAGDVDVIQKNERIQQMKQDWPVVRETGLANAFLADLIRLSYPDKGDYYAGILLQAQANEVKTLGALAAGLSTVLETMVKNHPEVIVTLGPKEQLQLGQLLQQGSVVKNQVQQTQGGTPNPV